MDIHKNLNQTTELDSARNDLSVEKKLLDCIENLVMNDDFTAAVNSGLTTILEYYDADRTYIFEFQWKENLTRNTYEICRDGISPQIENLQTVPVDVVARWVDSFEDQEQNTIIFIGDVDALKDDPTHRLEYDCLHPQGIKSLIAVPIFINGKLHGFLGIDNPRSHMDALTLLTQLTYIIANELQKRLLTEALTKKSYQDPLTGLNNRLAYDEMLDHLRGKEFPVGVGFLDINGMKWINDTLGHDMGNKVIQKICTILNEHIEQHVEFIDVMEREHMISMVDFTMLRQACELIQKWKPVWPDIVLNVNFSRNTLMEPDFLERIDQILSETGADPAQLIFEITESSQNIQLESLYSLLDEVKQRGISLAIDDLGTEASCLEMLYLPQISVAKIDKGLIDKAEHIDREQLVIKHVVDLCHDLNMRCVAEGIETDSQIELLKKLGCDKLQGYKIGKPMLPEDFLRQFGNNR